MPEERARRRAPRAPLGGVALGAGGSAPGRPSSGASSRKKSATRSSPAPTQTTSPDAQSWSSCAGRKPGTRRGRTSDSQSATGSESPCSGTSASRRRRPPVDPLPGGQEAAERRLVGRLDLLAQRGERRPAKPPQDVGIAPLPFGAARTELAADEPVRPLERAPAPPPPRRVERRTALGCLGGRERAAAAREAHEQRRRAGPPRLEEGVREARRRHRADGVAVAAGVLGRDQPLGAPPTRTRTARRSRSSGLGERRVELAGGRSPRRSSRSCSSSGRPRRAAQLALDLARARRGRSGREAPPGRAARAAGRGRARAPAPAARRAACRPRTCTSRCSRRAARRRTGDADCVSTSTRSIRRASQVGQQPAERRAGRRRPGGTRGTSRARSGSRRSGGRPGAGPGPSAAAARAACAGPAGGAG